MRRGGRAARAALPGLQRGAGRAGRSGHRPRLRPGAGPLRLLRRRLARTGPARRRRAPADRPHRRGLPRARTGAGGRGRHLAARHRVARLRLSDLSGLRPQDRPAASRSGADPGGERARRRRRAARVADVPQRLRSAPAGSLSAARSHPWTERMDHDPGAGRVRLRAAERRSGRPRHSRGGQRRLPDGPGGRLVTPCPQHRIRTGRDRAGDARPVAHRLA